MPWFLGNSQGFLHSFFGYQMKSGFEYLPGIFWFYSYIPDKIIHLIPYGMYSRLVPLLFANSVITGFALWHAAKRKEYWWFVTFLFIHTAGILDAIYLIWVAKVFTSSDHVQNVKKPHTKKKRS